MNALLAAVALLLAAPASAQKAAEVRRGTLEARVKVSGTVVAEDVFRLKSSIEGRIEAVLASSYTWAGSDAPLGLLANTELAALMDARQTTPAEVLEARWQKVYQPTQIKCPADCFILGVFARTKKRVLPQAVLFEAARSLRLVGRVRPNDAHGVKDGLPVEFWPASDPKFHQRTQVERFVLDVQGQKVNPGGTFSSLLDRKRYLNPGTAWEGYVVAAVKKSALQVPTKALIRFNDSVYLPVRVSTGITTEELTELTGGVEQGKPYLIIDASEMGRAEPHFPSTPPPDPVKRTIFFDDQRPGANRAFDESGVDKPAGDRKSVV
jgi:hypothetical protein